MSYSPTRTLREAQSERVDQFISGVITDGPTLVPAFHPVIEPVDEDWQHLQMTFSYTFRNRPYEYHNGGLWAMITGFYVADLAARNKTEQAKKFRDGIHWANALPLEGEPWSFPEFVHGQEFEAGGTRRQGWSAAAAVIAHHVLKEKRLFRVGCEQI